MVATTKPTSWSIRHLTELGTEGGSESGTLRIPKYQRGLVWDDERRRKLIDSIQQGHPVGSLLIWERTNDNKKEFHLIDGLQRTQSIFTYVQSPLSDFDPDWLDGDEIDQLTALISGLDPSQRIAGNLLESQVRFHLKTWLNATRITTQTATYNPHALVHYLLNALTIQIPPYGELDPFIAATGPLCDAIELRSDIYGYELPVILYEGPEESLPDIFEKINANGVSLTKYDRLAASWQTHTTRIIEPKIREAIKLKYSQLVDQGFVFADYDPDDEDQYNLYEYLFGLGKHLSDTYPDLIQSNAEPFDVESFSFSIATVVHKLRLSEIQKLHQNIDTSIDQHTQEVLLNPSIFEIGLMEAFDHFGKIVKSIYDLRLNAKAGGPIKISIPEYQLASYVARIMAGRYNPPSFEEREGWQNEWNNLFPKAIREHFLSDTLLRNWKGSGDTRLFNTVWTSDHNDSLSLDTTYIHTRDRNSWDTLLASWFDESLQSQQKDRQTIRPADKVFLRFIYTSIISVQDNADVEYELDHIIPVARLRELIPDDDAGWPISNVANLVLIPKSDNRKKRAQTLYEYAMSLAKQGEQDKVDMIGKLALFPLELCSVPEASSGVIPNKAWFLGFLNDRFKKMKCALYETLEV